MLTKNCVFCGKSILPKKKFCNSSCAAKFNNSGRRRTEESKAEISAKMKGIKNKFSGVEKIPRVESTCYVCGTIIRVKETEINNNHTCKQKKCIDETKSIGGRKSAAARVSRSKNEVKLFELCADHFSNTLSNHIIADNWDADIVLLDQKIAILWNGPWHYKEMNISNHSLQQVQNRDKIKIKLFLSLGWHVYVFEDRYYTPEQAFVVVRDGTAPPSITYEVTASL